MSLHADSCIDATGFKVAYHVDTSTLLDDQRLQQCIEQQYAAATGLSLHPNTVTHDMTGYHAFNRIGIDTPAAILEMGFLGRSGTAGGQSPVGRQAASSTASSVFWKTPETAKSDADSSCSIRIHPCNHPAKATSCPNFPLF
ncbi:MAG: hypothetical protein R2854_26750 [Caldilineaceae bacterium]